MVLVGGVGLWGEQDSLRYRSSVAEGVQAILVTCPRAAAGKVLLPSPPLGPPPPVFAPMPPPPPVLMQLCAWRGVVPAGGVGRWGDGSGVCQWGVSCP
jgi:hypothetical protein